ncbi:MAG: ABC transporter permease [Acidobacteriota bacterium]
MSGDRAERELRRGGAYEVRAGVAWLLALTVAAVLAPWLSPFDPVRQIDPVAARLLPPGATRVVVELPFETRAAERIDRDGDRLLLHRLGRVESVPAADVRSVDPRRFLLGTDRLGRDVASRCLWGARVSLIIGFASLLLSTTVGVGVGAAAALGGAWVDAILMRLVDALLAFPWIMLLIALAALFPPATFTLVLLLGCTSWGGVARLARAEIAGLRRREFVQAARGLGVAPLRVVTRHILPHVATPLAVAATLRVAGLLLAEASLSFLGFGVPAPDPSWGGMIAESRYDPLASWWLIAAPATALVGTVVAVNLIADGLRDVLDPRTG